MKTTKKVLLGIATVVWPVLVPAVAKLIQVAFPGSRYALLAGITVGWFSFTALFVYMTFHAMRNPALAAEKKSRWMMYLLLCNIFAVPAYWYHYIWRVKD
jgi:hypothetical protein